MLLAKLETRYDIDMNFKIHTEPEDDQDRQKQAKPAPNYSSTAVKLRLMSLVALLVLVLMAMEKAAKPETWERLGFREPVAAEVTTEAANIVVGDDPAPDSWQEDTTEAANVETKADSQNGESEFADAHDELTVDSSLAIHQQFWPYFFDRLNNDKKRAFSRMLRYARINQPLLETYLEPSTEIINRIGPAQKRFFASQEGLDDQTLDAESKILSQQRQALAAIAIGEEADDQQREMVAAVEKVIDEFAMQQIRDRTPMTRSADAPAWTRTWERVLASKITDPEPVTHFELMTQGEFYRGKFVEVVGTVRGVQRISTTDNELGIESYFVVWMQPDQAGTGPFCIYTFKLPDDFPAVGDQFTDVDERASVVGAFFKLRIYTAKSGDVPECPLLLARTLTHIAPQTVATQKSWQPDARFMVPFFILAPLVVGYLAYRTYQSTRTEPTKHGKVVAEKIETTLNELKNDPDIKSDAERIQSLSDREF